jgi:hypothetical protein
MTLEDMLRAQRNHAMDAAAHAGVEIERLTAEIAALKARLPAPPASEASVVSVIPRQAAKIADGL